MFPGLLVDLMVCYYVLEGEKMLKSVFLNWLIFGIYTDAEFVDKHFAYLIQRVTSVMPIADKLIQNGVLTREVYLKIQYAQTTQDRMRELFRTVRAGGPEVKSALYKALKEYEPYLIQDLKGKAIVEKWRLYGIQLRLLGMCTSIMYIFCHAKQH